MQSESHPIIVVGGGGAGLIAAWKAASMGAPVLLLERNRKPGIKLLISGGGKCNVTHDGPIDELGKAFPRREERFLRYALHTFTNEDVRNMLIERGVPTIVREDGRVFPGSSRAGDVVGALVGNVESSGGTIRLNARVTGILSGGGSVSGIRIGPEQISSRHVILTTGGASYKKTGTTGDGISWGRELDHRIVPVRPALAPMRITPPLSREWRGVAVRGGRLSIHGGNREIDSWRGDILFTHEGISGPAALGLSRSAALALEQSGVTLHMDFFPSLDFAELDSRLNQVVNANRGKQIDTILCGMLPDRIVPHLLGKAEVPPSTRGHVLTRDARRRIVALLKSWEIGGIGAIDIDRGEVTAGGIALDDVLPLTMESRKITGLYFAGEVLDIAGPIGGYNLQAAFSTGYVAGESAARSWRELNGMNPHTAGSHAHGNGG